VKLDVPTRSRRELVDITALVGAAVRQAGLRAGAVLVFSPHTTAAITIQENADPDVLRDLMTALEKAAPRGARYRHDIEGPDDMPAHIRTMLTATSLGVPVLGGKAQLGIWQAIYLIEHRDRPHRREILLHFVGTLTA
jgi:secondary thiamine-phosphate synthase enzyme